VRVDGPRPVAERRGTDRSDRAQTVHAPSRDRRTGTPVVVERRALRRPKREAHRWSNT